MRQTDVRPSWRKLIQPVLLATLVAAIAQGCANEETNPQANVPSSIEKPISAVPGNAQIVVHRESGATGEFSYTPERNGIVYLYDITAKRTLDVTEIDRGETYHVLPEQSVVKIGDNRVKPVPRLGRVLPEGEPRHEYRIYFSPHR